MWRALAFSATLVCFLPHQAQAQSYEAGDPITIGPVRMGMTLEEIRAAVPKADWREVLERDSLYQRIMQAKQALELFGGFYDVRVSEGAEGEHELVQKREARVEGAKDCEQLGLALIENLENSFGRFRQSVTVPDFRLACSQSREMFCARNIKTIQTQGGSEVRVLAKSSQGNLIDHGGREPRIRVLALGAETGFGPYYDAVVPRQMVYAGARYEANLCRISVQVERFTQSF